MQNPRSLIARSTWHKVSPIYASLCYKNVLIIHITILKFFLRLIMRDVTPPISQNWAKFGLILLLIILSDSITYNHKMKMINAWWFVHVALLYTVRMLLHIRYTSWLTVYLIFMIRKVNSLVYNRMILLSSMSDIDEPLVCVHTNTKRWWKWIDQASNWKFALERVDALLTRTLLQSP